MPAESQTSATDFWKGVDPEIAQFEQDLLASIAQAKRGEFARVHTPEAIAAARRVSASTPQKTKTSVPIQLKLDQRVITAFKATGTGWEARINATLLEAIEQGKLQTLR
ncbi:MAG: hypothetical protein RLZZ612_844 [Pseudomonadota bacterium]|jgi:uncharacterized protein (DUF4415 family)